jgi:hypothetical protein
MLRQICPLDCSSRSGSLYFVSLGSILVRLVRKSCSPSKYSIMRRNTETSAFRCKLSNDLSSRNTSASSRRTTTSISPKIRTGIAWKCDLPQPHRLPRWKTDSRYCDEKLLSVHDRDGGHMRWAATISHTLAAMRADFETYVFHFYRISPHVSASHSVQRLLSDFCHTTEFERVSSKPRRLVCRLTFLLSTSFLFLVRCEKLASPTCLAALQIRSLPV